MKPTDLTNCQVEVLANVIRRLRKQANKLEYVMRSPDRKKLADACDMLHVTMTQLLWIRNAVDPDDSGIFASTEDRHAS